MERNMNVYLLLDASGSMMTLWTEAINSINGYVKKLNKDDHVHLVAFDSISYKILRDMPVEHWLDISSEDAIPGASTPLYDACGKIMRQAEQDGAKKTMLVVMTDGFENASQEFTQQHIKDKVKDWEDNRKWEVVFLGANFDAVGAVSGSIGIAGNKTLNYGAGNFARGMDVLAAASVGYSTQGTAVAFTDNDKITALGK